MREAASHGTSINADKTVYTIYLDDYTMSGRNAPEWLKWKDCPRCGRLEDPDQGTYLCQVCGSCQRCCSCSSDTDPEHTLPG